MASIYDRPALTPAQLTRQLIEQARKDAERDQWAEYEEENKRLNGIRFNTRSKSLKHGTRAGYARKCRCEPCKKANSDYLKAYRLKRGITQSTYDGRKFAHGTYYSYQMGYCRCDLCVEAGRIHRQRNADRRREQDNARKRRKRATDPEWHENEKARKREWWEKKKHGPEVSE